MRQYPVIGETIHALELSQQLAQCRVLGFRDVTIVVADNLDADGVVVDVPQPVPHAPAGMGGDPGSINNPNTVPPVVTKYGFLPPPDFVERAGLGTSVVCRTMKARFGTKGPAGVFRTQAMEILSPSAALDSPVRASPDTTNARIATSTFPKSSTTVFVAGASAIASSKARSSFLTDCTPRMQARRHARRFRLRLKPEVPS